MATYARKTCSDCGIMLPQPEMLRREVTPTGVRGNALSPRLKWFCVHCAPPTLEEWRQESYERDRAYERAFREKDAVGKLAWREEQERRRLANLAKRTGDA